MSDTPENMPNLQLRSVALAPGQIEVGQRLRRAKPHRVEALAADMQVQGQLQPILVCESETKGKFLLVDGGQRYAALVAIKVAFIDAVVLPEHFGTDLRHYAQIMANVNREKLTKLERAEYLTELRDVWKKLDVSAQHGGDRRSANVRAVREHEAVEDGRSAILALSEQVAEEVGLSRRAFFRAVEIAKGISVETKDRIRDTWIGDHQSSLLALAKVSAALQEKACDALLSEPPTASTMADALQLAEGRALPKNDDKHYHRVTATWGRLSLKSRRAFIDEHQREILDHARAQGWTI
jgi:ParB family chromosome partitioning protein